MNLRAVAHALGGDVSGNRILCPGPGHSREDRSLSVWLNGGTLRVHSFAGDDWRECDAHVRQRLALPGWEPDEWQPAHKPRPAPAKATAKTADNGERAREIFAQARDIRGTLGERYLAKERGLVDVIDDANALTIRFHPACPFRDDGQLIRAPAIVAGLRDPYDMMGACQTLGELGAVERALLGDLSRIVAIQRLRLTPDGKKVGKGMTLGPMGNSVIFVGSIWHGFYHNAACISEGLETALSMHAFGHFGCVALAGVGRLAPFEPPFHWLNITISGERDNGASSDQWQAAGQRLSSKSHNVKIWLPPEGHKDANDSFRASAS